MDNVIIRKLDIDSVKEFKDLIFLFEDVFEMDELQIPSDDYLKEKLSNKDFFVFVAMYNNKVIAGLTAYVMHQYYSTKPIIYIYDLAVLVEYQRKGIGKKLINEINLYCKNIGFDEVFVQADMEDDYAIDFYNSTKAIGRSIGHFYYKL